jgi:hypothetical protein
MVSELFIPSSLSKLDGKEKRPSLRSGPMDQLKPTVGNTRSALLKITALHIHPKDSNAGMSKGLCVECSDRGDYDQKVGACRTACGYYNGVMTGSVRVA